MLNIYIYWHKCSCHHAGQTNEQLKIELLSLWTGRLSFANCTDVHPYVVLMIICPGGSGLGSRHSALVGEQHLPPQACSQGSGYIIDHPDMRMLFINFDLLTA